MKVENFAMVAKDLKEHIEGHIKLTKPNMDAENSKEAAVFEALEHAVAVINEYLATQQLENRTFEEGKAYYDTQYMRVVTVEKRTPKGIRFEGAYGANSLCKWINGNEVVRGGCYHVKA